jgi:hypothetical protein
MFEKFENNAACYYSCIVSAPQHTANLISPGALQPSGKEPLITKRRSLNVPPENNERIRFRFLPGARCCASGLLVPNIKIRGKFNTWVLLSQKPLHYNTLACFCLGQQDRKLLREKSRIESNFCGYFRAVKGAVVIGGLTMCD